MENNEDKYSSSYRISKLCVVSSKFAPLAGDEAIKIYYELLVSGICYASVLQEKKQYSEACKVLIEMLNFIENSPVKLEDLFEKTNFLKDSSDFGTMEHGVVE